MRNCAIPSSRSFRTCLRNAICIAGAIILSAFISSFTTAYAGAASVELDHVDGLIGQYLIPVGVPITFYFKFNNNSGGNITGCTNGIRLISTDGATWQTPVGGWQPEIHTNYMDGGVFVNYFSADGAGTDTIGFGAFSMMKPGIPNGYNSVVFTLTTTFNPASAGKTVRLDSCYYPSGNVWRWVTTVGVVVPSWPGPYNYIIVSCAGNGDVNCDNSRDLADAVYMINYIFKGGPAPCPCP